MSVGQFQSLLDGGGEGPNEQVMKKRFREIMRRSSFRAPRPVPTSAHSDAERDQRFG